MLTPLDAIVSNEAKSRNTSRIARTHQACRLPFVRTDHRSRSRVLEGKAVALVRDGTPILTKMFSRCRATYSADHQASAISFFLHRLRRDGRLELSIHEQNAFRPRGGSARHVADQPTLESLSRAASPSSVAHSSSPSERQPGHD